MFRTLGVFFLVLTLAGCASSPKSSLGRKLLQNVKEKKLDNGLTVLYIKDESLPYVHLTLLVESGSVQDEESKDGLAALTADLLDKGTLTRSAVQIADEFGALGTELSVSVQRDYAAFTAQTVSTKGLELADLFTDVLLNPTFQEAEFRRLRQRYIASAQKRVDNPSLFAATAWSKYAYGDHPYSNVIYGTPKTLNQIQRRDINKHYLVHYRPNRSYLAVVGKWSPELEKQLEEKLLTWQPFESEKEDVAGLPSSEGRAIRVIHQPQGVQSQVYVGQPSVPRSHPDYDSLQVAGTILGGAFESRLMQRIRKELGLTYGVRSAFRSGAEGGLFQVSTATKTESTRQVVEEIEAIIQKALKEGFTEEELEATKGYLRGMFPRTIERSESLAFILLELRLLGLPDSELTGYLNRLSRMRLSTVNEAFQRHVKPDHFKVLIYGHRGALQKQFSEVKGVEWISQQQAL